MHETNSVLVEVKNIVERMYASIPRTSFMEAVYGGIRPVCVRFSSYTTVSHSISSYYMAQHYDRMSPYHIRRFTVVILNQVFGRISPYTVVYDRAYSTWVFIYIYFNLILSFYFFAYSTSIFSL